MTREDKKSQAARPTRPARPEENSHSPLDPPLLLLSPPTRTAQERYVAEVEWRGKLVGKKLCDGPALNDMTYSKDDLPMQRRILAGSYMLRCDSKPFRINVYVGEDDKVTQVWFG